MKTLCGTDLQLRFVLVLLCNGLKEKSDCMTLNRKPLTIINPSMLIGIFLLFFSALLSTRPFDPFVPRIPHKKNKAKSGNERTSVDVPHTVAMAVF